MFEHYYQYVIGVCSVDKKSKEKILSCLTTTKRSAEKCSKKVVDYFLGSTYCISAFFILAQNNIPTPWEILA